MTFLHTCSGKFLFIAVDFVFLLDLICISLFPSKVIISFTNSSELSVEPPSIIIYSKFGQFCLITLFIVLSKNLP